VLAVDADVVLVAVEAFLVLLGPACVFILLRVLGRIPLPPFRRLACFDRLVLLHRCLLRRSDNDRIDDLAASRDVALGI
jgi:hypothetical protein